MTCVAPRGQKALPQLGPQAEWLRHSFCPPHGAYFAPIHLCLLGQQVRCLESIVCLTLTSISAVFRSMQLGQIGNCSRIHSLPVRVVECFVLSFLSCTKSLTTFHYYSDGHVAGLQRTAKSSHRHSRHVIPLSDSNRQPLESGADCQFYQLRCIKRSPIQSLTQQFCLT